MAKDQPPVPGKGSGKKKRQPRATNLDRFNTDRMEKNPMSEGLPLKPGVPPQTVKKDKKKPPFAPRKKKPSKGGY